jgi:hypothetical protein
MSKYLLKSALPVIIVLLLICCITSNGYAQTRDSLLRVYNNETIHTFGKFYVKGSKQLKFRDLKSEFSSGITKDLYRKAKGDRVLAGLFTVTAVGALVTGIIVKKNNNTLGNVLSGFAIGLNLGSIHFRNKSTQLIDRAIWHRNKEILFGVQQ